MEGAANATDPLIYSREKRSIRGSDKIGISDKRWIFDKIFLSISLRFWLPFSYLERKMIATKRESVLKSKRFWFEKRSEPKPVPQ